MYSCILTSTELWVQPSVVELIPGYGICCTQWQRDEAMSSSTTPGRLIRRLLPVFFLLRHWHRIAVVAVEKTPH